ncbi:MAG: hypothetical protein WCK49_08165 [Myxococcaceae bacterium]
MIFLTHPKLIFRKTQKRTASEAKTKAKNEELGLKKVGNSEGRVYHLDKLKELERMELNRQEVSIKNVKQAISNHLKAALFMPALVAIGYNSTLKAFYQ